MKRVLAGYRKAMVQRPAMFAHLLAYNILLASNMLTRYENPYNPQYLPNRRLRAVPQLISLFLTAQCVPVY